MLCHAGEPGRAATRPRRAARRRLHPRRQEQLQHLPALRLCEQKLGNRAFFIQSEANIRSRDEIEHYVFPAAGHGAGGHTEIHPLWPRDDSPKRVLITGGASCPDGLVQQVVTRINSFFPPPLLRSIDDVLAGLESR